MLRESLYQKDKMGVTFAILQEKALKLSKQLGVDEGFKASLGWIHDCLTRVGKVSVHLHIAGMELTIEEEANDGGLAAKVSCKN